MKMLSLAVAVAGLLLAGCGSSAEPPNGPEGQRPLNTFDALGRGGNSIPAGRWGGEIEGTFVEIRPAETLETVAYDYDASGPDLLRFVPVPEDFWGGFVVKPFEGFVDGVDMRVPSAEAPLTSDEFIDGLSQAISITNITASSIAGQDSITFEFGSLDPASPFACEGDDRDELQDDELCIRWGIDGLRTIEFTTITNDLTVHYIESLGMIVAWAYTDTGVGNPFSGLMESLLIDP